ncbi:MAG: gamma-glutamyltransferase [Tepidisphaeraceae bacterium]
MARADEAVQAAKAVVIAGHPVASQMGLKVLQNGGNAIDALVTTSLALGVAEPGNSGLGGKFVMTYYDAKTGRVSSVVAMDAAPLAVPVDEIGNLPAEQRVKGWKAVCVPGLAAALGEAHAKWGTKPWAGLVSPAAQLARTGVKLSDTAADMLAEFPTKVADPAAMKIYAPTGKTLASGQTLRNPDLADTLDAIAKGGWRAFYTGPVAKKFVEASQKNGGYFTPGDFASYKPRFLEPLSGTYRGMQVFSSPPPLTGGTTLIAALKCLENASDLRSGPPRQAGYIDLVGRVLRQVYPATAAAAADVPDSSARVAKVLTPDSIREMVVKSQNDDLHGAKKSRPATRVCRCSNRPSTTRPRPAPLT